MRICCILMTNALNSGPEQLLGSVTVLQPHTFKQGCLLSLPCAPGGFRWSQQQHFCEEQIQMIWDMGYGKHVDPRGPGHFQPFPRRSLMPLSLKV